MDHHFHPGWPFLWVALVFAFIIVMRLFRHREQLRAIDAARRLAEADKPLPPELVEALKRRPLREGPDRDLRGGIILLAVAVGVAIMATVFSYNGMGPPGRIHPMYGGAAFLALIGLTLLGLWRFGRDRPPT